MPLPRQLVHGSCGDVRMHRARRCLQRSQLTAARRRWLSGTRFHLPAAAADADVPALPAPRFKWRGRGWLAIATSRWRVLGCSADVEDPARAWAVTYFEKTLFTPAGLDVYAREPGALPREVVERILEEAKRLEGEAGRLAEGFFEVARSGR